MIQLNLTREEHYALTALLRCAVSAGTVDVLGLRGPLERLTEPYRRELKERTPDIADTTEALKLPGFTVGFGKPFHLAPQSWESLFEDYLPVDWYTWSGGELAEVQP